MPYYSLCLLRNEDYQQRKAHLFSCPLILSEGFPRRSDHLLPLSHRAFLMCCCYSHGDPFSIFLSSHGPTRIPFPLRNFPAYPLLTKCCLSLHWIGFFGPEHTIMLFYPSLKSHTSGSWFMYNITFTSLCYCFMFILFPILFSFVKLLIFVHFNTSYIDRNLDFSKVIC